MSHLAPAVVKLIVSVYAVNAQSENRHLTANVKDKSDHNAVRGGLSNTTDEDEWHFQGVRNHVRTHVLDRVERVKAIRQQINYLSYVFADHYFG